MRSFTLVVCLAGACLSQNSPPPAPDAAPNVAEPAPGPDLSEARFLARTPGSNEERNLQLRAFTVEVTSGAQATTSHLTLDMGNPGDQQVEAFVRLPIPPGAAVTRAVLHVGDRPMEGQFVARDRARTIYRAITERRRDPALIVWSGPEWIEASVFPVEPRQARRLELEWVEPTANAQNQAWYRVPVVSQRGRQVARPERLLIDGQVVARAGRNWLPLPGIAAPAVARQPGDPFSFAFSLAGAADRAPARLLVAVETSRQIGVADRRRQRQVMDALLAALPVDAQLSLFAVDWLTQPLAEGRTPAELRAELDKLDALPSAGALDLEQALATLSAHARRLGANRILFLGRGLDDFAGDAIAQPLRQMQEAGQSLVVLGADPAATPLGDATALTGGHILPLNEATVGRALAAVQRTPASLNVDNHEAFFPLETVTGETRWLTRFVGDGPSDVDVQRGPARELEALWARAHVLGTQGRDTDEGSRRHVLTPLTSILVLESEADYARWGLGLAAEPSDPKRREIPYGALMGQNGVGGAEAVLGGLAGTDMGAAYGVAGLGLTGVGGGGSGRASEGKFGGRRARAPEVVPGMPSVRGNTDREILRRVVRAHHNEIRFCYESELVRQPSLAGRMAVQFVISPQGQVITAVTTSTTLNNDRVEQCVVRAVKRWPFPKTMGGNITIVTFPFVFAPPGGGVPALGPRSPDLSWDRALAGFRGKGTLNERATRAAALLSATAQRPVLLAWWIVENHLRANDSLPVAHVLAANLLREAGQPQVALRILSEVAPYDPATMQAELRRWGDAANAARLTSLEQRGRTVR